MRAAKTQQLRRRAVAASASTGGRVDVWMGLNPRRQLKKARRYALPAQKWPGHRRLFLEGAVLRPTAYRTALRG